MRIKRFKEITEAISGTELIGSMGPNYGEDVSPNTITNSDVTVLYSEPEDKWYTQEDYNSIYAEYLSKGGKPLIGVTKENLDKIVHHLQKN